MKFYRVKEECDNKNISTPKNVSCYIIARELYTVKEFEKKINKKWLNCFELVEVSKKATHWFFGARFADNFCYGDFARKKYNY